MTVEENCNKTRTHFLIPEWDQSNAPSVEAPPKVERPCIASKVSNSSGC